MILISAAVAGKGRRDESGFFLVVTLSAALCVTDLSAGNTWQAMIPPIFDFLNLCAASLWLARVVDGKRLSSRSY